MLNRIIFLDIDGVLNGHAATPSGYCGIDLNRADAFNAIVDRTGAKIVVTSAWRYLVHSGSMTLKGFEHLLRTHGVKGEVIGVTGRDAMEQGPDGLVPTPNQRGLQVTNWLREFDEPAAYVVIDDMDLGINDSNHPFVQTVGTSGLSGLDADRAVALLLGSDVREEVSS